jgi:hypothetical protein
MAATKATQKAPVHNHGKKVQGSMSDQIDRLDINESVAVAKRLALDGMTDSDDVLGHLSRLRTNQASYIQRVKDDIDTRQFKIEGGTFITDDKSALIVSVVITRIR